MFLCVGTGKRGSGANGGTLSGLSGSFHNCWRFHATIDEITSKGSSRRLLYGKSGIFEIVRVLLPMRVVSTHESLKVPPFGSGAVSFAEMSRALNGEPLKEYPISNNEHRISKAKIVLIRVLYLSSLGELLGEAG